MHDNAVMFSIVKNPKKKQLCREFLGTDMYCFAVHIGGKSEVNIVKRHIIPNTSISSKSYYWTRVYAL